ncbi:histone acetyltransferase, MYST family [Rhizodiscina lignyota]|uniref:histone acetyltransferase n=1 Tax=Rhizodiscina lignyota TaxID=1504668 RepID=A0A9P4M8C2_9PEZI|nr:histone acetyltransferase, MYST family [Rhizodiscina lignyota]
MAPTSPLQTLPPTINGTPAKPRPSPQLNVQDVVLGNLWIKPWYPSFYPEDLIGRKTEKLFVCEYCFKYSKDLLPFIAHRDVCALNKDGPPGTSIYEDGPVRIHEVDGEDYKLYTQNLSLLAKLFLDTKSVFYDVTTFLYYLLVYTDPTSSPPTTQVVGFFSKEKLSWDNNNLACILVFPPWQRKGFGQVLMGASYVLSKREGRLGGPEKPLSEPGRKGYERFWSATIARYLVSRPCKKPVTVKDISDETYIVPEDVIATLKDMGVLERKKRGSAEAVVNKVLVKRWMEANGVSLKPPVDLDAFSLDEIEVEEEEEED